MSLISYKRLIKLFSYKATPIGIPVSGPVQTEKDMRADFTIMPLLFTRMTSIFHCYAVWTPFYFLQSKSESRAIIRLQTMRNKTSACKNLLATLPTYIEYIRIATIDHMYICHRSAIIHHHHGLNARDHSDITHDIPPYTKG